MSDQPVNVIEEIIRRVQSTYDNIVAELDVYHILRLVIFVGGYIFLRNAASKYLANKQLKNQIEADNQAREQNQINELVDKPDEADASGNWGWGKKTRKVVKRHERIIEEHFESLRNGTTEDDRDIEDLLED
ncbi:hypothetical protein WICMUC_003801 [Wickerhamomyces mucosus]|uniref:Uncharacterized protein n=1 Tax=Wickerhamomyces mucosus TaxID=1378264 RepID=A0A9P8PJ11_9ASCO|nr:hypothetical protein WICMUC_003801 [Wickerhamomyces mucosus]